MANVIDNYIDKITVDIIDLYRKHYKSICIHCKTQQEAKKFINYAYCNGFRWYNDNDGDEINNTEWYEYKEETCYCLEENNRIVRAELPWLKDIDKRDIDINEEFNGKIIIMEFDKYIWI